MLVGRQRALEIDGHVARRVVVYGCRIRGGSIGDAEVAEEPVGTLRLPLAGREATDWLRRSIEDLWPVECRVALERLTRAVVVAGDGTRRVFIAAMRRDGTGSHGAFGCTVAVGRPKGDAR